MIAKIMITSSWNSMHFVKQFLCEWNNIINFKMAADKLKPPWAMYIWNIIPHSTKLLWSTLFFLYKNIVFLVQAEYSYFFCQF